MNCPMNLIISIMARCRPIYTLDPYPNYPFPDKLAICVMYSIVCFFLRSWKGELVVKSRTCCIIVSSGKPYIINSWLLSLTKSFPERENVPKYDYRRLILKLKEGSSSSESGLTAVWGRNSNDSIWTPSNSGYSANILEAPLQNGVLVTKAS